MNNKCGFCGIGCGKIEGVGFKELSDWPDLPIVCDNNLLAASIEHFDKVIDRLKKWSSPDFNQELDARLLNDHHAARLKELNSPIIRLAMDHMNHHESWSRAFEALRKAGIAKAHIRSYALIGFNSDPGEAWARCQWIEAHGIKVLPMWFHALDCLKENEVSDHQKTLGWDEKERLRIMGYFYQHRGTPLKVSA